MWRRILAWLLAMIWRREEKMAATITLGGITFPLSDFAGAANAVIDGVRSGKSKEDILASLEPQLLPVIEDVAAAFIPGGGLIVGVLAFALSKSKRFADFPQSQQNEIMNRAGMAPGTY
jgi:hypothetical protein